MIKFSHLLVMSFKIIFIIILNDTTKNKSVPTTTDIKTNLENNCDAQKSLIAIG